METVRFTTFFTESWSSDSQSINLLLRSIRKHGTFRPTLKALVQQNEAKQVESTTRKGFAEFSGDKSTDALKTLTTLRGIGPATASLLLSVYDPDNAPFFSDELFRLVLLLHHLMVQLHAPLHTASQS